MSAMPNLESLSREELIELVEMHIRTFDVAYWALADLALPGFNDLDRIHQRAEQALATIDRYPNDPAFRFGAVVPE
jgi:hypothetical protein